MRRGAEGWRLHGIVLAMPGELAMRIDYEVDVDFAWRTRQVSVALEFGDRRERAQLTCDPQARWTRDGIHLPALDSCVDVDLSVTPSTNTLPIRRLGLAIGESSAVTAAWVRFPEFTIERLDQVYTRTGQRRYRYESGGGAFTAELEVDAAGVVLNYPPAWERVGR